jgi:6-phospho-beta-glucosidase
MKLAVAGGGSTYTPELVEGVARLCGDIKVSELALVDPDDSRLAVVGPFSARILSAYGHPARVSCTTSLDEGLDGAGAVLLQLRVGGQLARHQDETWPLEYGRVGQETAGVGGLAKAMRTVPVVLEIAERARRWAADDAWIIDFTNPVGIVTRALLDSGHRAIGLCNVAIEFQNECAALLGVAPERVELDHVGLNHLTWARAVLVDGVDRLPDLIKAHGAELADGVGAPLSVLRETGCVPSYYLRYYWAHDAQVEAQHGQPSRAQQVAELERELLEMYADPELDHKPALLGERGGAFYSKAAVSLLAALVTDASQRQVVNVRNAGTLAFLPDEAVIEAPATVSAGGAVPLPVSPLSPLMRGLVAHMSAYEELALDAALRGGRDRVALALLAHPLIGQYDTANRLADRLVAQNAAFLPWAGRG